MDTITLSVPGMMCAHCQNAITTALSLLPGVESVLVDLLDKEVTVLFAPTSISVAQIKTAIEDQGFDVA